MARNRPKCGPVWRDTKQGCNLRSPFRGRRGWVLLNASPDIRQQINETPELHPKKSGALRNSPIKAVVVTNADVDHITGLISLREGQPFSIYGSDRVLATLNANSIFNVCAPDKVPRITFELDKPTRLEGAGVDLGLTVEAFAVPGKVALFLEKGDAGRNFGSRDGDTIGLKVSDTKTGKAFFYIPGCAEIERRSPTASAAPN